MQKTFSPAKIARFKREAKAIAKSTGLIHSAALDQIAQREGYTDWGLLTRNSMKGELEAPAVESESTGILSLEAFRDGLTQFIKSLSAGGVRSLCGGGASLWVRVEEVVGGKLNGDNIEILGPASDTAYRQYARERDLLLAVSYEGMGDGFVFPGDVDDDGEPIQASGSSVKFTIKEGRSQLLDDIISSGSSHYEGLMDKYNLYFDRY